MRRYAAIICLAISVAAGNASSSHADDLYLYLSGIPGESLDEQHVDWIDLLSWEWQVSNNTPFGGSHLGENIVRPLIIQKYIDKASPLLTLTALTGTMIDSAILHGVQETGDRHTRLQITMSNVLVSNVAPAGAAGIPGVESLALRFELICYRYTPIDSTGAPGESIERCFNVLTNEEP